MRTRLFITVSIVLAMMIPASPVFATQYDTIVTGTGDPNVDVPAVQAAVDQGGRVLLRGTFDFGDYGYIDIRNDIEIYGEKRNDQYGTVILGGWSTFRSGLYWEEDFLGTGAPFWLSNGDDPHQVSIQDIHFDNPLFASIHLYSFNNVEIRGNKLTDGRLIDFSPIGFFPVNTSVWLGTWGGPWFWPAPDQASGTVVIANNYFDGMWRAVNPKRDPWAVYIDNAYYRGARCGIFTWDTVADIHITGNEFTNQSPLHHGALEVNQSYGPSWIVGNMVTRPFGGGGIFVSTTAYRFFEPFADELGPTHIERNTVQLANNEDLDTNYSGIHVWGHCAFFGTGELCDAGMAEGSVVSRNTIRGPGAVYGGGLHLFGVTGALVDMNDIDVEGFGLNLIGVTDSVVEMNDIVVRTDSGMYVWASDTRGSNNNLITKNTFEGRTDIGIWVGDIVDYPSSNENIFIDNDLSSLKLVASDLGVVAHAAFLPLSAHNTYVGDDDDIVIDLGTDNEIIIGREKARALESEPDSIHARVKRKLRQTR